MKRILCCLSLLFIFFAGLFATEELLSFNAGLSSGIPFYSSGSLSEKSEEIDTDHRVIIGTFANINLNVIKQVTFFTGADIFTDFNWQGKQYANHLHMSFPLGVKIYPNLWGFDFGLAYTLGFRSDFLKNEERSKSNNIASWGNGFKFLMEYNFAHEGKSKYYPTLGCSWNFMPRGNYSYDNIIAFYIAENF